MPERIADSAKQLGRGISKLRKQRGWSQDQLSALAGPNRATISLLEGGKSNPSFIIVEEIAKALETTISGLIANGRNPFTKTDEALKVIVGENVKFRRLQLGLSRTQAADRVGLLPQYFSTTENCRRLPTLRSLLRLAVSLEIAPSCLLHEVSDKESPSWGGAGVSADEVSRRIHKMRLKKEFTRNELALRSEVGVQQIYNIELKGRVPTIATTQSLAFGLAEPIEALMDL